MRMITFYGSILSEPPGNKDLTIQKIVHNIPKLVVEEKNENLMQLISLEEVE